MVGIVNCSIWYSQRNTHLKSVSATYCHWACCNSMVSCISGVVIRALFSFIIAESFQKKKRRTKESIKKWLDGASGWHGVQRLFPVWWPHADTHLPLRSITYLRSKYIKSLHVKLANRTDESILCVVIKWCWFVGSRTMLNYPEEFFLLRNRFRR